MTDALHRMHDVTVLIKTKQIDGVVAADCAGAGAVAASAAAAAPAGSAIESRLNRVRL